MNADDASPTDRLERALQASLRPLDPGVDFTAALQARLAATPLRPLASPALPPLVSTHAAASGMLPRWLYPASLAFAASIVVTLAVGWQMLDLGAQRQAEQARLEQTRVHTQLLLALEITSERLGQAQRRIEQFQSEEKSL